MTTQPSEQPTPWTKAGKALLDLLYEEDSSFTAREVLHAILAIEAEAAAPDPDEEWTAADSTMTAPRVWCPRCLRMVAGPITKHAERVHERKAR